MGATTQIKQTLQAEFAGKQTSDYNYKSLYQQRLIEYRKERKSIVRIEKPTNIPRARQLGFKAKEGVIVVRAKVRKGSGLHQRPKKGRRPKRMGVRKLTRGTSIQGIAEKRANKKYPNCEVLNSYWIGEDGQNKYYEVILIDTANPSIQKDKDLKKFCEKQHENRAEKGLTSAQKKSRGQRKKRPNQKGSEKNYPSIRSKGRKAK